MCVFNMIANAIKSYKEFKVFAKKKKKESIEK